MGKSIIQDVINRAYAKVYRFYRTMIMIRDILGSEIVPEGEYRKMERRRNQIFTLSKIEVVNVFWVSFLGTIRTSSGRVPNPGPIDLKYDNLQLDPGHAIAIRMLGDGQSLHNSTMATQASADQIKQDVSVTIMVQ